MIALNILVFLAEVRLGGGEDIEVLYRLGALFPPAVCAGQWWRLIASTFLHFGPLHLAMNMIGLWILGPFAEFALGLRRFVLVYLLAGVGGMATVLALSFGAGQQSFTVGASGCVMGLVGATAALMLRGWLRENAQAAKRRLGAMLLIVSLQTVFDCMVAPREHDRAPVGGPDRLCGHDGLARSVESSRGVRRRIVQRLSSP